MGIQLDWDVESERGWDHVDEHPADIEQRRRTARQLRLIALGVLLFGLGGGGAALRLQQVNQQLQT
ncbi:MAG: hypothetical protein GYB68_17190, partial [Chloroflexi bacterium]|nr:hypothetical protein [Chloroflexota bacterium]